MEQDKEILLDVHGLKKYFPIKNSPFSGGLDSVKAVDGVDMFIRRSETLGLVGESGCGKSTLSRLILRLIEPTEGQVFYNGTDILALEKRKMRNMRKNMQLIFQDPFSSLDPRMPIGRTIGEPLEFFRLVKNKSEKKERVAQLLTNVGLDEDYAKRYPHEFSGGQRQRISIARALASSPQLVICDEPVSALDVSVRSQVLNLMQDLQDQFNLTYLFITHDLSVAEFISDRMAVMYLGRMVEIAEKSEFYQNPLHPYTKALLSAVPQPDPDTKKNRIILSGDVPTPINPPSGCTFHPRCKYATDICKEAKPQLTDVGGSHFVSCHLYIK
ncbi:MAG: dipeptide ABC transporter ATP-binding protein [Dehalobacterium sp.]